MPQVRMDQYAGENNHGAHSASSIQRILILHLGLHETCMDGASLGEGASLEELSEQILYYHQEQEQSRENGTVESGNERNQSLLEEAVQFLGLCTALYSMPAALRASAGSGKTDNRNTEGPFDETTGSDKAQNHQTNARTNVIYFEDSTLVFVPLEESTSRTFDNTILAVVQTARSRRRGPRAQEDGNAARGNGCNPYAIRISIERSYRLFCMLNGGNIKEQLRRRSNRDMTTNQVEYERMNDLFGLLKDIRKHKETIQKGDPSTVKSTSKEIAALQAQLKALRRNLPIQAIRRDLDAHFKEYVSNFALVANRNGGAGRCLVEAVPIPIAYDYTSHVLQVPADVLSRTTVELLKASANQLLQFYCLTNKSGLSLMTVCTFHKGHLLHVASSLDSSCPVSNETANQLMAYMMEYKTKMAHPATKANTVSIRAMAGTLNNSDAADVNTTTVVNHGTEHSKNRGSFLVAPPSFMMGAGCEIKSIEIDGERQQKIWAPHVTLPITDRSGQHSKTMNMVVFEFLQFSFLLIVDLDSDAQKRDIGNVLLKVEEELTKMVVVLTPLRDKESATEEWTNSPGQEILLLDRSRHSLVLLQDPNTHMNVRGSQRKGSKKGNKHWLLAFGKKKGEQAHLPPHSSWDPHLSSTEWSTLGLDCRHLLSSRLPLDVCLAFDDMISEMAQRRALQQPGATVEMCTCLSCGWIYSFATGDKECYAFFDNAVYVTVADVTSAAKRIKETFHDLNE